VPPDRRQRQPSRRAGHASPARPSERLHGGATPLSAKSKTS
jgi:hypothetical protein